MPELQHGWFVCSIQTVCLSSATPQWQANPVQFSANSTVVIRLPSIPDSERNYVSHFNIRYRIGYTPTILSPWLLADKVLATDRLYTLRTLEADTWAQVFVQAEGTNGTWTSLPSAVVELLPPVGVPGGNSML